ncbi:hypothetical protein GGX14DRAFT_647838 [Mycena pura]|uniref:Uncharacterized protein n=1 Tax=Mycena pura TaxID=153505 RepID=A0AAD6Y9F8_9AGAR|nr:hypothetical protein GGX14DRAFT_647838 [Mycena pura]
MLGHSATLAVVIVTLSSLAPPASSRTIRIHDRNALTDSIQVLIRYTTRTCHGLGVHRTSLAQLTGARPLVKWASLAVCHRRHDPVRLRADACGVPARVRVVGPARARCARAALQPVPADVQAGPASSAGAWSQVPHRGAHGQQRESCGTTKGGGVRRSLWRLRGGEHAWSFRARSREDMMEWRKRAVPRCERADGALAAAVRAAGYLSEEEEEGSDKGRSVEE